MFKSTRQLLVMGMLGGLALAQSSTSSTTKTSTTAKPASTVTTTTTTTTVKPAAKVPVKKVVSAPKVAGKPKPSPVKAAGNEGRIKVKTIAMDSRRRDPFVNPLQLQDDKLRNTAACTTGARCLMIDQVVLKGVVKTQAGMIAMVENASKKQYNLREKDPVYNGFVLKITGDTIVFKESNVDNLGKATSKEVVKRVTVPAV